MPEPPKSAWVPYGRTLRQLRTQAGLTCRQLARESRCAESLISKIERGRRSVSGQVHNQIATALAHHIPYADQRLRDAHTRSQRAAQNTWHTDIADLEAEATTMAIWEPLLVPGIFQTAAYAEAIFIDGRPNTTQEEIIGIVGARMERARAAAHKEVWVVLDETALYRTVGGAHVMAAQIRHLIGVSSNRRKITIFPRNAPYCGGLNGPLNLLSTQDQTTRAYVEHTAGGEIIHDPDEIGRVSSVWRELSAWALSPSESIEAMEEAVLNHELKD